MFTTTNRGQPSLCIHCDREAIDGCARRVAKEGDVAFHARLPESCSTCSPERYHPLGDVFVTLSADVMGRIAASLAAASDKTYATSVAAKLTEEKDPMLRFDQMRVIPEILSLTMNRSPYRRGCCCWKDREKPSAFRVPLLMAVMMTAAKRHGGRGQPPIPPATLPPGPVVGADPSEKTPTGKGEATARATVGSAILATIAASQASGAATPTAGTGQAETQPISTPGGAGETGLSGPPDVPTTSTTTTAGKVQAEVAKIESKIQASQVISTPNTSKSEATAMSQQGGPLKKSNRVEADCELVLPATRCGKAANYTDDFIKMEVIFDGAPNPAIATKVGPSIGKPAHYTNEVGAVCAMADTRIKGKQKPFKPGHMKAKIRNMVEELKKTVFTKERVRAWRDKAEDSGLETLVSHKWSKQQFEVALDNLAAAGIDVRVQYRLQIKSEVKEVDDAKGDRPRGIMNCGPEAQICMKVVIGCLESILFEYFGAQSIKHKAKVQAVKDILAQFKKGDRIFEGDGSAWDVTVTPGLKAMVENDIIFHVAQLLFGTGDIVAGALKTWYEADMATRKQKNITAQFTKCGAVARLTMSNTRMSGDAGTSCLNWLENAVCWAVVVLDDPTEWVRDPNAVDYSGPKNKRVRFKVGYEGDDSVVGTSTGYKLSTIEEKWDHLGFNMKIFERAVGERVIFVGMEAVRYEVGFSEPIPEVKRGIVQSAWTLMVDPSPAAIGMSIAARAAMNAECELMSRYYAAIAKGWLKRLNPYEKVLIERDDQYELFGDYDVTRKVTPLEVLRSIETTRRGDAVLLTYMSKEDMAAAYAKMDAFDGGLDYTQSPTEIFPAAMFQ